MIQSMRENQHEIQQPYWILIMELEIMQQHEREYKIQDINIKVLIIYKEKSNSKERIRPT